VWIESDCWPNNVRVLWVWNLYEAPTLDWISFGISDQLGLRRQCSYRFVRTLLLGFLILNVWTILVLLHSMYGCDSSWTYIFDSGYKKAME
jgi:hypothetical protein